MNLLALSRNLFLVIRLNILSELLRKWRDKNNSSHLKVAHAFRRQMYCAVRKFKKKNVIKPLLNYVHVACLFRTGMQLGHKLVKKRTGPIFSQYRPHASSITSLYCAALCSENLPKNASSENHKPFLLHDLPDFAVGSKKN